MIENFQSELWPLKGIAKERNATKLEKNTKNTNRFLLIVQIKKKKTVRNLNLMKKFNFFFLKTILYLKLKKLI